MSKPDYLNALQRRTALFCCVLVMVGYGGVGALQAQRHNFNSLRYG